MQNLDPITLPLSGCHLIEASAGTGKTYTITALYVRLLLERDVAPENILVVTFTEAACQELRDQIREKLTLAHSAMSGEEVNDPFLNRLKEEYIRQGKDLGVICKRIYLAVINFDLASVLTIHGFCMRVLQDSAFESGLLFETEFVESDLEILKSIIDDYWRNNLSLWHSIFVDYLCTEGINPDSLAAKLPALVRAVMNGGMEVLSFPEIGRAGFIDQQLLTLSKTLWCDERHSICKLLDSPALSKAKDKYCPKNINGWSKDIDAYFCGNKRISAPIDALHKFSQKALFAAGKKNKKDQVPVHPFFEMMDEVTKQLQDAYQGMLYDLVQHCSRHLKETKRDNGVLSFDDLLLDLRDGLTDQQKGETLAHKIRNQYPVALIDEFQDTDPVQYQIFQNIYHNDEQTLFLVGDPKQAIYGFRGADIFAYLAAAKKMDGHHKHTLLVNWRSEPGLIQAVNLLFGRFEKAFVQGGIHFHDAASPPEEKDRLVLALPDDAPMAIRYFSDQENRPKAKDVITLWLVDSIIQLLHLSKNKKAKFRSQPSVEYDGEGVPLVAGDIAVLVRKHRDGELIRKALAAKGINSVIQSPKSVFDTTEARDLESVLFAIAHPSDQRKIKAALSSRLMGVTAEYFLQLEEDDSLWDQIYERFATYQRQCLLKGVAVAIYQLIHDYAVFARLSGQTGGERFLTNIRHLIELMQEAEQEHAMGLDSLAAWYTKQRQHGGENESTQIKLESDENLVKIVTIHKSKGLQYPVVFCPFVWEPASTFNKNKEPIEYHDQQGRLRIDMGTDHRAEHIRQNELEQLAEELRLLYVALTRAKNRCFLAWARVKSGRKWATATSAFQFLVNAMQIQNTSVLATMENCFKELSFDQSLAQLKEIAELSSGTIKVLPAIIENNAPLFSSSLEQEELSPARQFRRKLNRGYAINSFSSLLHMTTEPEEPDHDHNLIFAPKKIMPHLELPVNGALSVFSFPRGARAGSCLHSIFEELDFQQVDMHDSLELIRNKLTLYGINLGWQETVLELLNNAIATKLHDDFTLAQLPQKSRLDEMEFYFSVPDSTEHELVSALMKGNQLINTGNSHGVNYIKGFIDLVFQWQDKFYIVDYKSNYLGDQREDYSAEALGKVMKESGYDLQYYIYTLALHRYLGNRLPEYSYNKHFGGVYYLFLRGMKAGTTNTGVFSAKPAVKEIERLDEILIAET